MNRGINHLHMSMSVTKLKQQISNLQSQIAQQQAAYVNKQPGGGHTVSDKSHFLLVFSILGSQVHFIDDNGFCVCVLI